LANLAQYHVQRTRTDRRADVKRITVETFLVSRSAQQCYSDVRQAMTDIPVINDARQAVIDQRRRAPGTSIQNNASQI